MMAVAEAAPAAAHARSDCPLCLANAAARPATAAAWGDVGPHDLFDPIDELLRLRSYGLLFRRISSALVCGDSQRDKRR